jgi:hypothetical protein
MPGRVEPGALIKCGKDGDLQKAALPVPGQQRFLKPHAFFEDI